MPNDMHDSLLRSLEQAAAHARGENEDVRITTPVDVKSLRKQLGASQREFAEQFHIRLDTLQSWEQGRRNPPDYAIAYLKTISFDPQHVRVAISKIF